MKSCDDMVQGMNDTKLFTSVSLCELVGVWSVTFVHELKYGRRGSYMTPCMIHEAHKLPHIWSVTLIYDVTHGHRGSYPLFMKKVYIILTILWRYQLTSSLFLLEDKAAMCLNPKP